MKKLLFLIFALFSITSAFSLLQNQLSCESGGYTWMDNSNYPATYSFTDDAIGSFPTGWTVSDSCAVCDSKIIDYLSHKKVLKINDNSGSDSYVINKIFSSPSNNGSIEFFILNTNITSSDNFKGGIVFQGNSGTYYGPNLGFNTNYFAYYDGVVNNFVSLIPYEANKWYHIKIEFNTFSGTYGLFNIYINGILIKSNANFYRSIGALDEIVTWGASNAVYELYLDAMSYSWDPNYHIGDNLMGGCCGDDVIDLRKGLVSEWHMDGNANDSIGSNNGVVTEAVYSNGKYGSALTFDGINDIVEITHNPSLNLSNAISVGMWVKSTNYTGYKDLLVKYYYDWAFRQSWNGDGVLLWMVKINGTVRSVNYNNPSYLWNGNWHYIFGVFDGVTQKLYVDGNKVTENSNYNGFIATSQNILGLGYSYAGAGYFNGSLDEVRVYNRALSDREVAYLYEMSPYSYINYSDTFYNGTKNVDSNYCVNNNFYTNLEQSSDTCNSLNFTYLKKDWLDEGFKYRKNITIANSGTALTDYQVAVNVSTYNTNGLVASYHFSEEGASIKDYSGENNHGSLYGSTIGLWHFDEGTGTSTYDVSSNSLTTTLSEAVFNSTAINGYSIRFNTDDLISIADSDKLSFTDGSGTDKPFSLSYWIKPESTGNQWLINKRSATGHEWQMYLYSGALGFTCFSNGESIEYITANITNPLVINQWNYVSATYDGSELSSGMNIYLNGVLLSTTKTKSAGYTGMSNTVSNVVLGSAGWNYGIYLNGSIDELAIYNKQLSADEVKFLYYFQKSKFIEYVEGYESKGQGIKFDGVSNYISTTNLTNGFLDFSINAWIKTNQLVTANQRYNDPAIIGLKQGGGDSNDFVLTNYNGYLAWYDELSTGISYSTNYFIADNKWHQVSVTRLGTALKFYVDGNQVGSLTTGTDLVRNDVIEIGRAYWDANSNYFNGSIDEVKIFNRTLSEYEIKDLYNERYGRLDYSDIRFYNSAGTELNYYHEYDNKFWVKIPNIPTGNSNITIYYGNPGAVSRSNGELTFDFFDDFESNYMDSSKWVMENKGSGGSYWQNNGFLHLQSTNSQTGSANAYTNKKFTNDFAVYWKRIDTQENYNDMSFGYGV
ncbi:MAG: DUF2341 domain-containing protein, partial [Candidatus Nanoarchaeia archaeon]|nr:DUF2341 domain-containing protein [Candidatus Nanoarchaeia archaeon]